MRKRIVNVVAALRLSFSSHRDILYGLSQYAKAHHWRLQLIATPESFSRKTLEALEFSGADGLITGDCGDDATTEFLCSTSVPLVFIGARQKSLSKRKQGLAFVLMDDKGIGRAGADYLRRLGRFRSFGFIPRNAENDQSRLRSCGFGERIGADGVELRIYQGAPTADGTEEDLTALERWLKDLPKPAAVMAVYDTRATHVLEAAKRAGIKIPRQLAVLGVDNDELLCEFTEPSLSSIAPDYTQVGQLAAQALSRLLAARSPSTFKILSPAKRIVERESTMPIPPEARLIDQALVFIRKKATAGITARDVIAHLGVSRRLAEKRFAECTGKTILATILDLRLAALKAKLRSTTTPIAKLSSACGFASENYAKNLFKKRFGLSMRQYRTTAVKRPK